MRLVPPRPPLCLQTGDGQRASRLKPLDDRVVVKPRAKEEMTRSGIVLPDTANEEPQQGTVLSAGPAAC